MKNTNKGEKDTYWNSVNKTFTHEVERYFNDYTEHFVTGDHWAGSSATDRVAEGKKVAIEMVKSGEVKISRDNNVMTLVMHSQGNAEGVGMAIGLIEEGKKQGIDVTVNLVFLAVHQPEGISDQMSADLKARGIQFTYGNDDAWVLQPQGKIDDVEDANKDNKKWKHGGLKAHSAPVDDAGAFKEIENTDQQKHIYTGKPQKK